jgi:uncharacterized membrane protein
MSVRLNMRKKEWSEMHGYNNGFIVGNGMMGGGTWYGGVLMFLLWALIVAAVVILIVMLVRRAGGHAHGPMASGMPLAGTGGPPAPPAHDEAVAIARKRFAAGDITKEQFDEIVKTLG